MIQGNPVKISPFFSLRLEPSFFSQQSKIDTVSTMSSEGNAVAAPAAVDLAELQSRIAALSESIKLLKSSAEPDKDAIATAVTALVDAKRTYAKNNGGIGVDGKPWEEPMSKSEKKKLEKEKKKKAAEAAAAGDANKTSEGEPMLGACVLLPT